jgi:hypothetical protein
VTLALFIIGGERSAGHGEICADDVSDGFRSRGGSVGAVDIYRKAALTLAAKLI